MLDQEALYRLLDDVYKDLDPQRFSDLDPISIPKEFRKKQDVEISALFSAVLAWGQRKTIIANLRDLMDRMDRSPHAFVMGHSPSDLSVLDSFKHRTFNGEDARYFISALKHIYSQHQSLEQVFVGADVKARLIAFNQHFFSLDEAPQRSRKHIADPSKGSAAKRLNMFLRWMVRKDGIDLGLWDSIDRSELMCPLDVHVRRAAEHFGLLLRKQNDWRAVQELSDALRLLDPEDPIRFDLSLFTLSESGLIIE